MNKDKIITYCQVIVKQFLTSKALITGGIYGTITILLSFLVLGLIVGWLIWFLAPQFWPQYTAETFIRVLPGTEKDSMIRLIKSDNTLELLIDRDKVQQTEWFGGLGEIKDVRLKAGLSELKRRICAEAIQGTDLIRISMTCSDKNDAATITNEIVSLFVSSQGGTNRKQIAEKLARLSDQQIRLQRDLDLAERALDDIRRRYAFADLEEHNYPHPITARLLRLQEQEDNCTLDMDQLQTHREALLGQPQQLLSSGKPDPNQAGELKGVELKTRLAQNRLARVREMREETQKKQDELELARIQYLRSKAVRNERQTALDSVKTKIEELKILYDNPDVSGLQLVDIAPIPLQADILPWQIYVPIAGGAGLLIGIICTLLTGKTKKPKQQD